MVRDVRDVLLAIHALGWLVAVIATSIRTGEVPPELWGILPFGVGMILTAFKVNNYDRRKKNGDKDDPPA